jgi:hypothetical protein
MKKIMLFLILIATTTLLTGCDTLFNTNEAPFILVDNSIDIDVYDSTFNFEDYITITDDNDGIIPFHSSMIDYKGFDVNVVGSYNVVLMVSDSDGSTTTRTIELNVIDNEAPVISLNGEQVVFIGLNSDYREFGVDIFDNFDQDLEPIIVGSVDTSTIGEYELVYYGVDSSGNVSESITRNVMVVANQPEVFINIKYIGKDQVSFNLDKFDPDQILTITAIQLYNDKDLIQSLDIYDVTIFDGLYSSYEYVIKVLYEYDLLDGEGMKSGEVSEVLITEPSEIPQVQIDYIETSSSEINFELSFIDEDNIGKIKSIELFQENILIESLSDLSQRKFSNLLSNTFYSIEITIEYDLNNGQGLNEKVFKTGSPINTNYNFEVDDLSDIQVSGSTDNIYLYEGMLVFDYGIQKGSNEWDTVLSFIDIPFEIGKEYIIKFSANSDVERPSRLVLWDGVSVWLDVEFTLYEHFTEYEFEFIYQGINSSDLSANIHLGSFEGGNLATTIFVDYFIVSELDSIKTLANEIPTLSINNIQTTDKDITFELNVIDPDQVGTLTSIDLYQGDVLVDSLSDLALNEFSGLLSDTEYMIKVTYTYDLNDGFGTHLVHENSSEVSFTDLETILEDALYYLGLDGVYYAVFSGDYDFQEARQVAELMGGHLATVTDVTESNLLNQLTDNIQGQAWLGGYQDPSGNWYWITDEIFDFTLWGVGEPSFLDEDALEYNMDFFYWNDIQSNTKLDHFIVEFDKRIVKTKENKLPEIYFENIVSTNETIAFELNIIDSDQTGTLTSIDLYQGDVLVDSLTDLAVREFTALLSNNEYTIKVTYTYDLNDGLGERFEEITVVSKTLEKDIPTIDLSRITEKLTPSNGLEYELNNDGTAYLVSGFGSFRGTLVVIGGTYNGLPIIGTKPQSLMFAEWIDEVVFLETVKEIGYETFYGVSLEKAYFKDEVPPIIQSNVFGYNQDVIVIVPDQAYDNYYNVNEARWILDVAGNVKTYIEDNVNYDEFFNGNYDVVVNTESIRFKLDITDQNQVGRLSSIDLYLGDTLIESLSDLTLREFSGLHNSTYYTIKVTYIYDLNDGLGERLAVKTSIIRTL